MLRRHNVALGLDSALVACDLGSDSLLVAAQALESLLCCLNELFRGGHAGDCASVNRLSF